MRTGQEFQLKNGLHLPTALAEKITNTLNQGVAKMKQEKKKELESLRTISKKLEEDKSKSFA